MPCIIMNISATFRLKNSVSIESRMIYNIWLESRGIYVKNGITWHRQIYFYINFRILLKFNFGHILTLYIVTNKYRKKKKIQTCLFKKHAKYNLCMIYASYMSKIVIYCLLHVLYSNLVKNYHFLLKLGAFNEILI